MSEVNVSECETWTCQRRMRLDEGLSSGWVQVSERRSMMTMSLVMIRSPSQDKTVTNTTSASSPPCFPISARRSLTNPPGKPKKKNRPADEADRLSLRPQPWLRPPLGGGGSPRLDRRATLSDRHDRGSEGVGAGRVHFRGSSLGPPGSVWVCLGAWGEVHLRVPGPTAPEMLAESGANSLVLLWIWTERETPSPGEKHKSNDHHHGLVHLDPPVQVVMPCRGHFWTHVRAIETASRHGDKHRCSRLVVASLGSHMFRHGFSRAKGGGVPRWKGIHHWDRHGGGCFNQSR